MHRDQTCEKMVEEVALCIGVTSGPHALQHLICCVAGWLSSPAFRDILAFHVTNHSARFGVGNLRRPTNIRRVRSVTGLNG